MMADDPPYLTVGTEVSAKYKGAFCEAKVRKVVRSVKCKVTFKLGLGTVSVTDDQIRGALRVGAVCEVKHPEKKEFAEAVINKIQDCSQYTVVFDDGDITTLRRTALCLKSGRHFAESETLDQLPLTHPEHFSNPVIGGRKGRRSRQAQEDSSDEEDAPKKGKKKEEKEADIGKVVCVELGDKKKQKDNWFPGLVVAPTAQDTVRIRVKDEYLVRSFKDGRYFTVPKKEATEFTREIGNKVDNNTLKAAVEKALMYLDKDELPPHWDRDLLFGLDGSSGHSDSDGAYDSDSSDDEPREEKDHFVAQLYKFMDDRGTPINKGPTIGSKDVDLYKLFKVVHKLGGYNRVTNHNQWKTIAQKLGFGQGNSSITNLVKQNYKKFLHSFEDFYRKLGCTMVNHPRGHRSRHRTGRSLIRDRDRATPTNVAKDKEKEKKDEKASTSAEKTPSAEKTEKDASDKKKEEEKDVQKDEKKEKEEEKKEEIVKSKEPVSKKSKAREEKTETPSKQKGKDSVDGTQPEVVKKESTPRSKKEAKTPEPKHRAVEEKVTAPVAIEQVPAREPEKEKERGKETKSAHEPKSKAKERAKSAPDRTTSKEKKAKAAGDGKPEEPKKKVEKKHEKHEKHEKHDKHDKQEKHEKEEKHEKQDKHDKKEKDEKHEKQDKHDKKEKDEKLEKQEKQSLEEEKSQQTRSKSKEDARTKKDKESISRDTPRESKTPLRDANKMPQRSRKDEEACKDEMGVKDTKDAKEAKDTKDSKDTKDLKDAKDAKDSKEAKDVKETKDTKDSKDGKDAKEGKDTKDVKDVKDAKDSKKRGRKRKDTDDKGHGEESQGHLASHVTVSIGDKLKVYYGPTHESKVTYEAKVLDIEEDGSECMYLVHYTGWNTRYDEWIKRGRIADNLSWTPSRAKRQRHLLAQHQGSRSSLVKRGRPSGSRGSDGTPSQPPRSTTPSSVTSSSSRTKSPATNQAPRSSRSGGDGTSPAHDFRRRTRRMSGHTDISVPSDMESEGDYISDVEIESEVAQTRSKTEKKLLLAEEAAAKEEAKKSSISNSRKKSTKKKDLNESVAVASSASVEDDDDDKPLAVADLPSTPPSAEKRRSKRGKKPILSPAEKRLLEMKSEAGTESEEEQPKGRDFDLNQIRSELKGIEKAVKLPHDMTPPPASEGSEEETFPTADNGEEGRIEVGEKELPLVKKEVEKEVEAEDIYEFKEPEPFEFEVRKRDSLLSDERGSKLSRQRVSRLLDVDPPKPEKSPRKRLLKTTPRNEGRDSSSDTESKKKPRRFPQKKIEFPVDTKITVEAIEDPKPPSEVAGTNVTIPSASSLKGRQAACEQTFEKLCESSPFSLMLKTSSRRSPSPPPLLTLTETEAERTKTPELGPLSIFSEAHDDDGEDDGEDRLVISEPDDMVTENAEPLFSYQQRGHEDLFPTLVTSNSTSAPVEASAKTEDPPCLTPVSTVFHGFSSPVREGASDAVKNSPRQTQQDAASSPGRSQSSDSPANSRRSEDVMKDLLKHDEDDYDDPINAAIRRAIDHTIMEEDDTNDIDLFSGVTQEPKPEAKPDPKAAVASSPKKVSSPKEVPKKRTVHSMLSSQVMEESDTDSSDEEQRLVIDPMEEETSPRNESSPLRLRLSESDCELKLHVEDEDDEINLSLESGAPLQAEECSSTTDIESTLQEGVAQQPEGSEEVREEEVEEEEEEEEVEEEEEEDEEEEEAVDQDAEDTSDRIELECNPLLDTEDSSSVTPVMTPVIVKVDLEDTTKVATADILAGGVVVLDATPEVLASAHSTVASVSSSQSLVAATIVASSSITSPTQNTVSRLLCDSSAAAETSPIVALAAVPLGEAEAAESRQEAARVDDSESQLLGSLLCQETIPGSPAQGGEASGDDPMPESKVLVLEMPFASVPASSCDSTGPTISLPVPISVPLSIPVVGSGHNEDSERFAITVTAPSASVSTLETQPAAPDVAPEPEASISAPPAQPLVAVPSPGVSKLNPSEAAPVMENTPPTTPDSSLSTMSGSPREEHGDMSPAMDNESSKSHRDSFEMDVDSCPEGTKAGHYSEDDSLLNVEVSNSCDSRLQGLKLVPKKTSVDTEKEGETSPKKRRRSRKRSESESHKRVRCSTSRNVRAIGGTGSDSDDTSENSALGCTPLASSESTLSSKSPRPSKYNFYVELDPELDGSQRIALLQQKLQDLRKTYMNVKAELACIDRRRKKLRRREREVEKATKQEVACS